MSVKFNINANTGYPIVQTVFGPCLIKGKNAAFWECMLRSLTSSLVHFEEKSRAEKIISPHARKSNTAWLQLYAFLCAQTGCLITGRLPGAKAIHALIQAETNPDNAPARLNRIINQQNRRSINGTMIRDMMIRDMKSWFWIRPRGHTKTFSDDGQRAGMDKHRAEVVLRIERASLIEPGHGEHHLPIATAGKAYLRSTEAGLG